MMQQSFKGAVMQGIEHHCQWRGISVSAEQKEKVEKACDDLSAQLASFNLLQFIQALIAAVPQLAQLLPSLITFITTIIGLFKQPSPPPTPPAPPAPTPGAAAP